MTFLGVTAVFLAAAPGTAGGAMGVSDLAAAFLEEEVLESLGSLASLGSLVFFVFLAGAAASSVASEEPLRFLDEVLAAGAEASAMSTSESAAAAAACSSVLLVEEAPGRAPMG